jgi:hypothetical protein
MVAGYSPSQMRAAYNLPSSGGAGVTIAIIDPYDTPNIQSDLATFSAQFGLPLPTADNFEVHKMAQTLGTSSSWTMETSLDVEWAHAIAPDAKILLVEAVDNFDSSLLAAVDYARSRADVVAISMSWGHTEVSYEAIYDSHFTSSYGAVFFASSGDNGAGVSWPACSANVVGVGGTTLSFNADGTVSSETGWSGSGGGISAYVSRPTYQATYGLTNVHRQTPDVSYNANPNTGVAVYYNSGWHVVGGTSAGAPQWAAIQALSRSCSNNRFYTDARLPTNASYFRDITSGSNGAYSAIAGYDLVTGLGSPLTANFAYSPPPTNETSTVTLLPSGTSTPLNSTNRFAINYTVNGTPATTYASNGTLTLTIDSNTNLTVAGTSTGSNAQEKWVFTSNGNPVSGKNLTLSYSNLLNQTAFYTVSEGNPQKPTFTYVTAPASATATPANQTAVLDLNLTPQTVWTLQGSNASITNPLSQGLLERWFTQNASWQFSGPNQVPQPISYNHQFLLNFTGVNATAQWYNSGDQAQVVLPAVFNRTLGTGQRMVGYSVDGGAQAQFAPTAGMSNFTVLMNATHTIAINSTLQCQVTLDASATAMLSSITAPTVSGDSGWYDQATQVKVILNSVGNRTSGTGQRLAAYSVNGSSTTVVSTGPVTVIDRLLLAPQTINATLISQYQLTTSSGDLESVTAPTLTGDTGWYDAGASVSAVYNYTWNVVGNQSRQNAISYALNQGAQTLLTRAASGNFTLQIIMNQPQAIVINSVTQYLFSYQFRDSSGAQLVLPSALQVRLNNSTPITVPQYAIWVDSGTQIQIYSIVWQNADVTPANPPTTIVNTPSSMTILCQIFSAALRIQTTSGTPVSGAQVSVILANQTLLQFTTGTDGTVSLPLIPRGTFNASVTYQGQTTTANGDATSNPLVTVTVSPPPTPTPSPTPTPTPTATPTISPTSTPIITPPLSAFPTPTSFFSTPTPFSPPTPSPTPTLTPMNTLSPTPSVPEMNVLASLAALLIAGCAAALCARRKRERT